MASFVQRGLRKLQRIAVRESARFRSPLRAAVIGYGSIGPAHADSYEATGLVRLVAMSDISPMAIASALDGRHYLRGYRDFRQMLDEVRPDIVSVCTWPQLHADAVEAAAAIGVKGILCEKPLAVNLSQMDAMITACNEHGVKLACGHQFRFQGHYMRAAELVRSGELGQILAVSGNVHGALFSNGPHLFDSVRFLLGDVPADRVQCSCKREWGRFYHGLPVEEGAKGEICFQGGIQFEFLTGDLSPDRPTIRVTGTKGSLEVTPSSLTVNGEPIGVKSPEFRSRQFREFLRWIKGHRLDYPADGRSGARTAELVVAAYESCRLGRPVDLPLRNRGEVIRQLYPDPTPAQMEPTASLLPPSGTLAGDRLAMDGGSRLMHRWFSYKPDIGAAELAGLVRVIQSKNLNSVDGREVPAFEREFAAAYGSPAAVASTSGTASIHVALAAINPDPCDEIVTTPLTDMGSVIPILACNCIPVFADVDPRTGNLTAETIASKLTQRTRAVILVHLFGRPADISPIRTLLDRRGIPLIEDCSQAHFAEYAGKKVGTWGDLGCFSLQQSKQMTCGDGGITLINREDLAGRATLFVDKGWDRTGGMRAYPLLGMNYRMTELHAAVARAQLRKLPRSIGARRQTADLLTKQLGEIPGVLPTPDLPGAANSWWYYAFGIDEDRLGIGPRDFSAALAAEGVRVRTGYLTEPLFNCDMIKHKLTYGKSGYPFTAAPYVEPKLDDYPGFQSFCRDQLLIFWSQNVRPQQVESIASAVRKVARAAAKARGRTHTQSLTCGVERV